MLARKYAYLIALARERHFGRAAQQCHVSVSTLSAAIRDLEAELGVAIVERGQSFSRLTAEGQCVLAYAQRTAAAQDDLRQRLSGMQSGLHGKVRLGVIPTASTVVGGLSADLTEANPHAQIEVLSLNTDEILRRLRAFEIEGGIVYADSARHDDLHFVPVWQEQHVLLASQCLPDRSVRSITWTEAGQLPLCLLTPDMQNRRTIDGVFDSLGLHPVPTLETNSISSVLAHVSTGRWCTILPRSVIDLIGRPRGTRVVKLTEPGVVWETGLVTLVADPPSVAAQALRCSAQRAAKSG